ncbi:MAG: lipopolysaccharide kinase InaA family protein, partial [Deltaproteobacteria bacterium]
LALAERGGVKNAIDGIEELTLSVAFETWDKKAARCMGANNLFFASRFGGLLTHIKRPWEAKEGMERVISSPDIFLEGKDRVILKNGRTVKAGLVTLPSGEKLFLKRYNRKGFFHTLKNVFKISRARDVWRKSYAAELRGLNVPRPVAYMESRSLGVLKRSYVVSEFVDGARLSEITEAGRSGEFFRYLGRAIGEMHRLGFFHGDLKWSNILVKEGIRPVFYFTDIDGSRVEKRLALSSVEHDIERFSREMKKYGIPEASKRAFFEGYGARNRFIDAGELCRYGER